MKRVIALVLIIVVALGCFASCGEKDDLAQKMIIMRINSFSSAYNSGDMDKVLECLDAKSRNTYKATFNLLGGFAGNLVGFDIDLSDLFSLGISTAEGDYMDLTINGIDVEDSSNATVAATMHLNGVKQKINFIMVYEDDGWYIHDMIER